MSKGLLAGVVIVVTAGVASAQTARPADAEQVRARQRISMMEGVFERAVSNGADNLLRQVRSVSADLPMLTGAPQVRGFRLDGYGVFFDVGVPGLRPPVTWQLRYFTSDILAASPIIGELTALAQDSNLDPRHRRRIELMVSELQRTTNRARAVARPTPSVNASALSPSGAAAVPPPVAPVEPDVLDDPNVAYTREIKAALIEAMLENSGSLTIAADEWLTVAARDNLPRDPLIPGDITDFSTMILRIKGADLAAFRAGRLTLEEARKRVEVIDQ